MPNVNLNLYVIRIEFGTNSLIWTHCKKMSAKYVYLEEWELFSHLKKKSCLKTPKRQIAHYKASFHSLRPDRDLSS